MKMDQCLLLSNFFFGGIPNQYQETIRGDLQILQVIHYGHIDDVNNAIAHYKYILL